MAKLLKIWFYSFITIISLLPDIKKVTCNDNFTVATTKKVLADNTKVHYIVTTSHARTTSVPVVRLSPATTTTTARTTTAALARTMQQTSELSCSSVRKWWLSKGIDKKHVSDHSLKNDSHLGTCMRGGGLRTCCTQVMEHKLEQIARQQLNTTIFKHQIERLKDSFSEKAIALFDTSIAIINGSAKDLHELFFKTYNTYYSSNSEMFANLYNTLRLYLRGDNINLVKVFDKFFMELVKKLFTLTNASYKFDDKYLECAGKQITSVQNFSQNTYSIFNLIKRSIVTTRVFIQALNVGKEVLALLSQLEVPATCAETFTRMSTCSYCAGLLNVRPCHQYCLNVMATCYAPYYAMHDNWVTFIDQLDNVVKRLDSSFMFFSAIDQLGMKLSDYIMEFQQKTDDIKNSVFDKCRPPSSMAKYTKREASPGKKMQKNRNRNMNSNNNNNNNDLMSRNNNNDPQMARVLYSVRNEIINSKNIFSEFTTSLCRSDAQQQQQLQQHKKQWKQQPHQLTDVASCWNGTSKTTSYNAPTKQLNISKQYAPMHQHLKKLQNISYWLTMAINDKDVPWQDDDEDDEGSGEDDGEDDNEDDEDYNGSGGGEDEDDDDDDDDDDHDDDESSGFGDDDEDVPVTSRKHSGNNIIPQHNNFNNVNNNNNFPYNRINDITTRRNFYVAPTITYARSHSKPYHNPSSAATTSPTLTRLTTTFILSTVLTFSLSSSHPVLPVF